MIPFRRSRTYLDWAAAAPVRPEAAAALNRALSLYANPSSVHEEGVAAHRLLHQARERIASHAAAKTSAVIFTSGATEGNTLAIMGRTRRLRQTGVPYERMHVLALPTAHASTRRTMQRLASLGVTVEDLPVHGRAIDLDALRSKLRPDTVLVSCDAAESQTGIRYDTRAVARVVRDLAPNAVVHVDASQLPLIESFERTRLGADLLVLGAQKVGGIRGVGVLISSIPGAIVGASTEGQEGGLRAGTEPVALAAAFAEALDAAARERSAFVHHAYQDRMRCIAALQAAIPTAVIIEGPEQLPHVLCFAVPGMDAEYAVHLLDAAGFAVSARSACESTSEEPSLAIELATNDSSLGQAALRLSWGPTTPPTALPRLVKALVQVVPLAKKIAKRG